MVGVWSFMVGGRYLAAGVFLFMLAGQGLLVDGWCLSSGRRRAVGHGRRSACGCWSLVISVH